ncbi:TetR/AcrR family transcriptional regulator [Dyadobacter endophyticus]|uniref:TetR family transcriptional regulator n=1 Tax=Dyadobacter endophyticus TaxID=1749036 RepID=A0ABQ1YEI5_9BACT|nr:TetR/AcrR family transcriptional regulator [Dyadobacter endophyticus]GGH21571.1 TetR family transcriptional regulator [Dyadobacter endophyticus]
MSIAKRKEQEKIEMHKRILDSARKIFLEKGYEQTSIRNIASEINYSPGSIYFYFKDKNEIFHELHKEGFRLFLSQMKALDIIEDPYERYKALGLVFIRFAQNHTDYYNLMFLVSETGKSEGEGFQIAQDSIEHLSGVIKQCQDKGRFQGLNNKYLTLMTLSLVHGICSLYCKDRMSGFFEKSSEELMLHGYETFIALIEKS